MVAISHLLITPLLAFVVSSKFCGTQITPSFRSLAVKFAAQDALDFPDLLNAAGTNLKALPSARTGSLSPAVVKKLGWEVPNKKWINVPTYIHVVAASKKYEDGWVSEKAVLEQIIGLNLDFGKFLPLVLTVQSIVTPAT